MTRNRKNPDPDAAAAAPASPADRPAPNVEVRRSARRRRTVSAYRDGDRTIVLLPARMSRAEEQHWVDLMLERLAAQERRRTGRASRGDAELGQRAAELSRCYFDGKAQPSSVRWVSNQGSRWGSCTPTDGTIRLSDRLRVMPSWVVDYVLVHELAHLFEPGHGQRFQALVDRYPKAERARGYLLGITDAAGEGAASDLDHDGNDVDDNDDNDDSDDSDGNDVDVDGSDGNDAEAAAGISPNVGVRPRRTPDIAPAPAPEAAPAPRQDVPQPRASRNASRPDGDGLMALW